MRRREFITLLGATAVAWPAAGNAQQTKIYRIGVLGSVPRDNVVGIQALFDELTAFEYREGENFTVEHRELVDDADRLSTIAAELVRSDADVIVVEGPEALLKAALGATKSIPIVMIAINFDPLARGYVTSLARPEGNLTGVAFRQPELAAKQLELLKEAFPQATRLAILWDRFSADQFDAAEQNARSWGLAIKTLKLENPPYDFDEAFRILAADRPHMVLVLSSPYFARQRPIVARAALQHGTPTMFIFRSYVESGGLMSYGVDMTAMRRRAAAYVAKILKGTRPGDLPIEQPTKFELVVNLKTAKALGIELPPSLLARADEVIE